VNYRAYFRGRSVVGTAPNVETAQREAAKLLGARKYWEVQIEQVAANVNPPEPKEPAP